MTNPKETKKIWEGMPLWKLNYRLAEVEGRIFMLIKNGETSTSRVLRRKREVRTILRRIMLNKLLLWDKGELIEIPPKLADILEKEKLRKEI